MWVNKQDLDATACLSSRRVTIQAVLTRDARLPTGARLSGGDLTR
jgi:hypothetical protein